MAEIYEGETFDEFIAREKLENFYGQYSSDVRKKLLSKNIEKPANLYDVLYTKVKEDLLSKNIQILPDLDKNAKIIRDGLLSKNNETNNNINSIAEHQIKSLLSKNKLLSSSLNLEETASKSRENLLSKNNDVQINLDLQAEHQRNSSLLKNITSEIDLDKAAKDNRNNLLSKNNNTPIDLDKLGAAERNTLLSKNTAHEVDLDKLGTTERNTLLAKNTPHEVDLDKLGAAEREILFAKNNNTSIDLDKLGASERNALLSKNSTKEIDLYKSAQENRNLLLSKNNSTPIDLDKLGAAERDALLSKNSNTSIDLDKLGEAERNALLSKNSTKEIDLDRLGASERNSLLSKNNTKEIDLDKTAQENRDSLLSRNNIAPIDLDKLGDAERKNLLSKNSSTPIDLDKLGAAERDALLSKNNIKEIDLDRLAVSERSNLLAKNTPNEVDLDKLGKTERGPLLAKNTPNEADLDKLGKTERDSLLAKNIINTVNLDDLAQSERNALLAANTPNNINLDALAQLERETLLASNISNNIDLDALATQERAALLASNTPNNFDLGHMARPERDALLASNTPSNIDLDNLSSGPRHNLLALNGNPQVQQLADLDFISTPFRNDLLSKNIPNNTDLDANASSYRNYLLSKNPNTNDLLGANIAFAGTSQFIGLSNLEIISAPIRELLKLKNRIFDPKSTAGYYYGLDLDTNSIPNAIVTRNAYFHNSENNTYALRRYNTGSYSGLDALSNFNGDGFQQMVSASGGLNKLAQTDTNTTTSTIIEENNGQYLSKGAEEILRPQTNNQIGSAESMMVITTPSDAIEMNFNKHERGVVKILNTIRKSSLDIAKNFDSQGGEEFIVGINKKDGSFKKAYQRFTIKNPYQPNKEAGALEFKIKNYSIGDDDIDTISFPPYIKSFSHNDSAKWNETLFLGRPEPIYTYANSSRDGSIQFVVLTDYSQSVDIGYDYENKQVLNQTFDKNFVPDKKSGISVHELHAKVFNNTTKIKKLQRSILSKPNSVDIQAQIDVLQNQINQIQTEAVSGEERLFSESSTDQGNVYKTVIDNGNSTNSSGFVDTQIEDTVSRLSRMKEKLLFQPAFFSGSKHDFLSRMEFIAKLTRPARNDGPGFSFDKPPVCHLHLGTWINHDVIINGVSYDYTDAHWTFDGNEEGEKKVQPMWCTVTINFNIVGPYGASRSESTPLSTTRGGYFQRSY